MANLFERTTINAVIIENRFVRSATWEGLAGDDGSVTRRLIDMFVSLAKGGVSLIIIGHAYIRGVGIQSKCRWRAAFDCYKIKYNMNRIWNFRTVIIENNFFIC